MELCPHPQHLAQESNALQVTDDDDDDDDEDGGGGGDGHQDPRVAFLFKLAMRIKKSAVRQNRYTPLFDLLVASSES